MDKILKHPVLREPAKWIPHLRQQHSLDLELKGFYNVNALIHNPLVKGLEATQSSVRTSRESTVVQMGSSNFTTAVSKLASAVKFSRGALMRVIIGKDRQDKQLGLMPLIGGTKHEESLFTPMYVYNNKNYLKHVLFGDLLWRKYAIPFKFKFNNRLNRGILSSIVERDVVQLAENLYKQKILELLPDKAISTISLQKGRGLILTTKGESLVLFRDSVPVINLAKIWPEFEMPDAATELAISYKDHEELCCCIFSFIDFMPELSCQVY
ncbi:uncharacterized protein KQ657_004256 [Scheffersomyces spartinae]|uniref:Uncharacterized protein n=1 Tax=Scheffersomyces spartinae TaxID=45513 RepID=A0A9P8AJY4_9ASCO|nr:uncharacterized protein KQ657_004256 [Scheffersomyces spartinae]KAG7194582.1 hypothetical protein KQ657_004256 [Scheffersomyces spartinae]